MRRDNGGYKPPKTSYDSKKGGTKFEFWNKQNNEPKKSRKEK